MKLATKLGLVAQFPLTALLTHGKKINNPCISYNIYLWKLSSESQNHSGVSDNDVSPHRLKHCIINWYDIASYLCN